MARTPPDSITSATRDRQCRKPDAVPASGACSARFRAGFFLVFGFRFWVLVLVFAVAFGGIRVEAVIFVCLATLGWFAPVFAGIRDVMYPFTRRPCAGRHLLSLPPQRK